MLQCYNNKRNLEEKSKKSAEKKEKQTDLFAPKNMLNVGVFLVLLLYTIVFISTSNQIPKQNG